jgi:hypothetical protein
VSAHDDAVDVPFPKIAEDLVGGETGAYDYFALDSGLMSALNQRLKVLGFGAGRCRVVVVANARSFRGGHYQGVIHMKKNEIGSTLFGLCESEVESALVRGDLGCKEDGGGFTPTRLDGHGEPPSVPKKIRLL